MKAFLTSHNRLKGLVETVVNPGMESQLSEHLSAKWHEHSGERKGFRIGCRILGNEFTQTDLQTL